MNNDIKNLDKKNGQKLKNIYKNRLKFIKEMILAATIRAEDTSFLLKLKKKLEDEIRKLENELQESAETIINDGIEAGFNNTQKELNVLKFPLVASMILNNNSGKVLKENTKKSLHSISKNINKKVKTFMGADFSNRVNVVNRLEKLADIKIPPSRIEKKYWQDLQKIIEKDLKKKDIFKVAYKNKNGDVVRHVNVETYAEMLARTISAESYRQEVKDLILQQFNNIGDLVEVVGNPICQCEVCAKYYGKIISLTGKIPGYVTLEDAKAEGLFHPNCVHYYSVTDNVMAIYNKKNPAIEHYNKAFKIANTAQNTVYKKGMKKGEFQGKAVDYLYKQIPKDEKTGYYSAGELSKKAKNILKAESKEIRFSYESLAKNIIKHPDLTLSDYLFISELLKNPDSVIPDEQNPDYNIVYLKNKNKTYRLVIKTTKNRKENYISSFRFTNKK